MQNMRKDLFLDHCLAVNDGCCGICRSEVVDISGMWLIGQGDVGAVCRSLVYWL